jgi:FkbM family methyltransferase
MKELLKRLGRRTGYRIERWRPANRFNAMADTLESLRLRGFRPGIVNDAGANVGDWTRMALNVVPDAVVHLVEPQPACQPALERLARTSPSLTVHPVALTEPGRQDLAFTGGASYGGTGVHVAQPDEHDVELQCRATTLDELFGGRVSRADDINDSGVIPVFSDVFTFLADRWFELYDVACMGWRPRDMRMCMMDPVFARTGRPLCADKSGL